ncbi:hypothetical protein [Roseovarius salinarum]|uniref:hypothetical protein n=1 Tax=Roseovarius salinarum TaxID=1981892 RepID=UPI000C31CB58|nr:hypothetical protein [Roseovarius salinarum]
MQVVLHAGAHKTDEDRLLKCLMKNRDLLSRHGTVVPGTGSYRKLLRDAIHAAQGNGVSDDARDVLLDAIVQGAAVDRLVLGNPGFFGMPKMAVSGGQFYRAAGPRMEVFNRLFGPDEVELFFAIRNPATFLPAIFRETPFENFTDFMDGVDPLEMRWSEMLTRIRAAVPGLQITVWCNEDTPFIWAEIVREMAGLDPTVPFEGEHALLSEIMTDTGMQRFNAYLESHPGMPEVQKRRVIAAFLDKFARETEIEEELDVPGWTEAFVDRLSEIYDEDVYEIQRMPGVTMIAP